ncbi:MAG: dTDP-4-dehydrorhamnose 3,5-epimerase [Solirubrobacterales bacterium]|nr:dTDP-4-dehydrorhamnose 3,5-epimerase [Solirubrobacterales bacterium]
MKLTETRLGGAWIVEPSRREDERGYFARTFDHAEFEARGMESVVVQCNTSFNLRAGTLRGMHHQSEPHGEPKLVRCTRGAIYDVVVDLRPASPTRLEWFGVNLTQGNGVALYVPRGMAHGFQTLADESEVLYTMGAAYVAEAASGVRWDDPAFGIEWPAAPAGGRVLSGRDAGYPNFAS